MYQEISEDSSSNDRRSQTPANINTDVVLETVCAKEMIKGKAIIDDISKNNLLSERAIRSRKSKHRRNRSIISEPNQERNHICELCGYATISQEYLTLHRDIHFPRNPCVCDVCKKKFRNKRAIVIHMRSHSNERPYICEVTNPRRGRPEIIL